MIYDTVYIWMFHIRTDRITVTDGCEETESLRYATRDEFIENFLLRQFPHPIFDPRPAIGQELLVVIFNALDTPRVKISSGVVDEYGSLVENDSNCAALTRRDGKSFYTGPLI